MKIQLDNKSIAFLYLGGSVDYKRKVHTNSVTKFKDMNDMSYLVLVRIALQISPTFLNRTMSLKVK